MRVIFEEIVIPHVTFMVQLQNSSLSIAVLKFRMWQYAKNLPRDQAQIWMNKSLGAEHAICPVLGWGSAPSWGEHNSSQNQY